MALAPLLQRIPVAQHPYLLQAAERLAAGRYRSWVGSASSLDSKAALLACADREDEIAQRVESLYPDAALLQQQPLANIPDLVKAGRNYFAPYSVAEQFALQAQGERLGAATWRAFAKHVEGKAREILLGCAMLEEQSAEYLESIASEHLT
jgi:hypothetical protein